MSEIDFVEQIPDGGDALRCLVFHDDAFDVFVEVAGSRLETRTKRHDRRGVLSGPGSSRLISMLLVRGMPSLKQH